MRELALCYERHPESVSMVPWLRPAGGDSVPGDLGDPEIVSRNPCLLVF